MPVNVGLATHPASYEKSRYNRIRRTKSNTYMYSATEPRQLPVPSCAPCPIPFMTWSSVVVVSCNIPSWASLPEHIPSTAVPIHPFTVSSPARPQATVVKKNEHSTQQKGGMPNRPAEHYSCPLVLSTNPVLVSDRHLTRRVWRCHHHWSPASYTASSMRTRRRSPSLCCTNRSSPRRR